MIKKENSSSRDHGDICEWMSECAYVCKCPFRWIGREELKLISLWAPSQRLTPRPRVSFCCVSLWVLSPRKTLKEGKVSWVWRDLFRFCVEFPDLTWRGVECNTPCPPLHCERRGDSCSSSLSTQVLALNRAWKRQKQEILRVANILHFKVKSCFVLLHGHWISADGIWELLQLAKAMSPE